MLEHHFFTAIANSRLRNRSVVFDSYFIHDPWPQHSIDRTLYTTPNCNTRSIVLYARPRTAVFEFDLYYFCATPVTAAFTRRQAELSIEGRTTEIVDADGGDRALGDEAMLRRTTYRRTTRARTLVRALSLSNADLLDVVQLCPTLGAVLDEYLTDTSSVVDDWRRSILF